MHRHQVQAELNTTMRATSPSRGVYPHCLTASGGTQATGAKWVKKVAPGGLAEGKLKVGQQVLVANGVSLLPLSHRDSVLILRDKLVITLGVTDWSSIGELCCWQGDAFRQLNEMRVGLGRLIWSGR